MAAVELRCPYCARVNDAHEEASGGDPEDGDVSLCWGCGEVAVFSVGAFGTVLREPTNEERREIDTDLNVQRAVEARRGSYDPLEAVALVRQSALRDEEEPG